MKIVLGLSIILYCLVGHASNRCSIKRSETGLEAYQLVNDYRDTLYTTSDFSDALAALQKLKAVGGCSQETTSCRISSYEQTFYLYNLVGLQWAIAYEASNFDSVVTAYGGLVQAGGCQP